MKVQSPYGLRAVAALSLAAAAFAFGAAAAPVDPATVTGVDVGPPTPYGETPEEAANKRVVFEWNYVVMIKGDPQRGFDTYVSHDMCDHSHMETRGLKPCATYDEMLSGYIRRHPQGLRPGEQVEIPTLASVNGDMVTMYGKGVDIFRVKDGKITDHWDASPPAAVSIPAHAPGFAAWVMGERHGPPPMLPQ